VCPPLPAGLMGIVGVKRSQWFPMVCLSTL
jgi:hypothetical protein